jgi:hypothetical protein
VVKQKGMVFGFRKTATAVTRPEIEEEEVSTCVKWKLVCNEKNVLGFCGKLYMTLIERVKVTV